MARVCVEVDLAKPLPKRILIGAGESGFWQQVVYEELPNYCTTCSKLGHEIGKCPTAPTRPVQNNKNPTQQWRQKEKLADEGGSGLLPAEKELIPTDVPPHKVPPPTLSTVKNPTQVVVPEESTLQPLEEELPAKPSLEKRPDQSPQLIQDTHISSDEDAAYIVMENTEHADARPSDGIPRILSSPELPQSLSPHHTEGSDEEDYQSQPETAAVEDNDGFMPARKPRKPYQKRHYGDSSMVTRLKASSKIILND